METKTRAKEHNIQNGIVVLPRNIDFSDDELRVVFDVFSGQRKIRMKSEEYAETKYHVSDHPDMLGRKVEGIGTAPVWLVPDEALKWKDWIQDALEESWIRFGNQIDDGK